LIHILITRNVCFFKYNFLFHKHFIATIYIRLNHRNTCILVVIKNVQLIHHPYTIIWQTTFGEEKRLTLQVVRQRSLRNVIIVQYGQLLQYYFSVYSSCSKIRDDFNMTINVRKIFVIFNCWPRWWFQSHFEDLVVTSLKKIL